MTTDDERQYRFDSIAVSKPGSAPKGVEPQLAFDKKYVYVGRSNYVYKLRDLSSVAEGAVESYDNDDFGHSGRRGRGGGGGASETAVLELRGRKFGIKCTVRRGRTAGAAHQLESFVKGLKAAHRKVTTKGGGKDPYAQESEARSRASASVVAGRQILVLGRRRPGGGAGVTARGPGRCR